jgi:sporulation protein YlmC with PRC-barrel domain
VPAAAAPATTEDSTEELLHLSSLIHRPLVDRDGERIGRVQDLIVLVGDEPHAPVVGMVVRVEGRDLFVPIRKIAALETGKPRFQGKRVDLRKVERREGELLLAQDLLARHIINIVGGRLSRANEIELARPNGNWAVVGVDPSSRPVLRRLLPGRLGDRVKPGALIDWESIEPFVSHVPSARLRIPYRKLAKLHPAQIADMVEAASHEEGEEIIEAVKADRELEADVFEELDTEHQLEFIRSRPDDAAARLLGRMAVDDAADLLMELDQERRLPVLELMPEAQARKIRSLLSYNPETAGGLMYPDFVALPGTATVTEALDAIRASKAAPEALGVVFALDSKGAVTGSGGVVSLLRAGPSAPLSAVTKPIPAHVHADWDIHQVVRKMSDFNLTLAPVLDEEHQHILGVITVDDVLELLIPSGWRRDAGMAVVDE